MALPFANVTIVYVTVITSFGPVVLVYLYVCGPWHRYTKSKRYTCETLVVKVKTFELDSFIDLFLQVTS